MIPAVQVCACGCGCEPDGAWHWQELMCACRVLGCACVTDTPDEAPQTEG